MDLDEEQKPRLDRREGLTEFLSRTVQMPEMPTIDEYLKMSSRERLVFNRNRHRHVMDGILVNTDAVRSVVKATRRTISINAAKSSGRHGVIVSGEPYMGKTTSVHAAMRHTFNRFREDHRDWDERDYIPVVYIEVPPGASGKAVMRAFADFFGMPERSVDKMQSLMTTVAFVLKESRTRLVVIDEANRIAPKTPNNGEGVDVLKSLSDAVAATFIYVGLNIHEGSLLEGVRGSQIDERTTTRVLRPFEIGSAREWDTWNGIVRTFEAQLCLLNHQVGDLAQLSSYLHETTGGRIGRLAYLLQVAVNELLYRESDPTSERITAELLEELVEDLWGEKRFANSARQPARVA